ncbi:isoprenyl transferase [Planctomonas psychrotolerans]|uniref:isoprenyl transferase n=1 Tax=Planctomonas psychrotolerans TaxID=2528712 RepID=UPI001239313C|nr:isoprenyl transferase [Planctomonas psychrotolerans]
MPLGSGIIYGLYKKGIRKDLTAEALPHHVAMIVDGNRRWARQRLLESAAHGHRAGAAKIGEFLTWCDDLDIRVVTLYLLSTDNLIGRAGEELDDLIEIIAQLTDDLSQCRDWRVKHVGNPAGLPERLTTALREAEERTIDHPGLHINLAVGYGGRHEIADAVRSILAAHHSAGGSIEELAELLTPDLIGEHLYTSGQPDPDLVIRTSGEQRVSDFMLWQSAHSELYFVEALYPDLREVDFLRALRDYSKRHRRYGA